MTDRDFLTAVHCYVPSPDDAPPVGIHSRKWRVHKKKLQAQKIKEIMDDTIHVFMEQTNWGGWEVILLRLCLEAIDSRVSRMHLVCFVPAELCMAYGYNSTV